jgi:two-component system response regulator NreC
MIAQRPAVTTLLLVSRHKVMTDGLRALFEAEPWLNVVGQISDTPAALEAVRFSDPSVIVLDLIAQALKGVSVIRQLKTYAPRSHIVALSMCTEDSYVSQALQNGASGYVLKSEGFAELLHAVREVVGGRTHLSPALDADAIRRLVGSGDPADRFESLTPRERQVLHLAAQGLTGAQIAARLAISKRTAETHRANIQKKCGFASHADLVSFALRRGLLTRDL